MSTPYIGNTPEQLDCGLLINGELWTSKRIAALVAERDQLKNQNTVLKDKCGEPDTYACVVYNVDDREVAVRNKLIGLGWIPPENIAEHDREVAARAESVFVKLLPKEPLYLDPPDGGDVSVEEQLRRYIADILSQRDALAAQLVEVNDNRTGVAPCERFCEALAAKKTLDNLRRERDALAAHLVEHDREVAKDAYWKGYVAGGDDFRNRSRIPLENVTKKATAIIEKLYPSNKES